MDYAKEALRLHAEWKGKIEVKATVPVETKDDLSLAYTPGVAAPCLEIQAHPEKSYELTRRHNLCAVITDGSAVLGLGDIGPEAGMPVMEGKCVLFKSFGDVDAFPLCVKTQDVDEFVNAVYLISGSLAAGQVVRLFRVGLNFQAGGGNAGGIGQGQIVLGFHRHGGLYFDFALPLTVEPQGFLCIIHKVPPKSCRYGEYTKITPALYHGKNRIAREKNIDFSFGPW